MRLCCCIQRSALLPVIAAALACATAPACSNDEPKVEYDAHATMACLRAIGGGTTSRRLVEVLTEKPEQLQAGWLFRAVVQTRGLEDSNTVQLFFGKDQHEATVQAETLEHDLRDVPERRRVVQRRSNVVLFWNVPASEGAITLTVNCLKPRAT